MTDLSLVRGDSRNYQITVTEADLVTPIDVSDPAILRFAVKKRFDQVNGAAIIFKTSYDAADIQVTDGPNGILVVKVFPGDTGNERPSEYLWDLDLTRRGSLLTSAGTIGVTVGSAIITGSGLDLSDVLAGDVLVPAGGGAPNQKDLVIISVGGDGTSQDPGVGNLLTDYSDWTTETGVSVAIYRGDRKTPVGGVFTLTKDVAT